MESATSKRESSIVPHERRNATASVAQSSISAARCQLTNHQNSEGQRRQTEVERQIQQAPGCQIQRARKKQRQVFGPAFDHRAGAAIHPGRQGLGRVSEADRLAIALEVMGQRYVFQNIVTDGAMSSDGEVSFALDQEKLAVRCGNAAFQDRLPLSSSRRWQVRSKTSGITARCQKPVTIWRGE